MLDAIYNSAYWREKALKYFSIEIGIHSPHYDIKCGTWQFANRAWGAELCAATMLEF